MIDLKEFRSISKDFTILYVEDEPLLQDKLQIYLKKFFNIVDIASNGQEALEKYKQKYYDIILTDISMPYLNGIDMSAAIKEIDQNQVIIIISAYSDTKYFIESIKVGVDGYILKPIDYSQLNSVLYKAVKKLKISQENLEYKNHLELLVSKRTKEIIKLHQQQIDTYEQTLYALVNMIEQRDTYTGGHSQRVAKYALMIAKELNLSDKKCNDIYQAGILHDIGKIVIPDIILLKPDKLDLDEYNIMKEHVNLGVDMISKIPALDKLAIYVAQHHERLDGSGYPKAIKGDQLLLESQILGISDIFDAMTTSRIYHRNKSIKDAIKEIKLLRNIHFKKEVVDVAIKILSNVNIDFTINQLPKTEIEKARFKYFQNI